MSHLSCISSLRPYEVILYLVMEYIRGGGIACGATAQPQLWNLLGAVTEGKQELPRGEPAVMPQSIQLCTSLGAGFALINYNQ